MAVNKLPAALLLALLLAGPPPVCPQDSPAPVNEEPYYVLRAKTGKQRIIQRLSWPRDENAYRYEVVVEQQKDGNFAEIHRESTGESFVEISLGPGNYRYRVGVYNLLDQREHTSNWSSFTIVLALEPGLRGMSPKTFFLEDDFIWELELSGHNFVEGAQVYLEPLDLSGEPDPSGEPIAALGCIIQGGGNRLRVLLDRASLVPGNYRVVIRNPGGLEAFQEPFKIRRTQRHIALSLDYSPLIFLHGYLGELFSDPSFTGFSLRSETDIYKKPWGTMGIEGTLSWNYLSTRKRNMDITAQVGALELNFFFRKQWLPMVFTVYGGAGLGAVFLLEFDFGAVTSDPYNALAPLADAGASVGWYITRDLYAELGIKYLVFFTRNTPFPGYLQPFGGLGWRF
jgi:hypothetical protein